MSQPQSHQTKLLIIGAGPAGYTAAIYAARAGLEPHLVTGPQPGGQLMTTTDVENYPGFRDAIQGPWLMEEMRNQAIAVGTVLHTDLITQVQLDKRPFVCRGEKATYQAEALIIATGAQAKWLNLESETHFRGYGVSACATCDGFFFKNKPVVVVGGGNTAVEEALFLTHHASHVTLVHRRDSLRAEKVLQERLFNNPKITVIWDHVVEEIFGAEQPFRSVEGIRLRHAQTGELKELSAEGVFIAIGHAPNTSLFKEWLPLDETGYILPKGPGTHTTIPGVFAAGDVQDKVYRQAVTAAGQGCMAALDAEKFLYQ
ncbi:MAG: thioredoxin-disulfide reductase [Alphaproteobacteria bacterium]